MHFKEYQTVQIFKRENKNHRKYSKYTYSPFTPALTGKDEA